MSHSFSSAAPRLVHAKAAEPEPLGHRLPAHADLQGGLLERSRNGPGRATQLPAAGWPSACAGAAHPETTASRPAPARLQDAPAAALVLDSPALALQAAAIPSAPHRPARRGAVPRHRLPAVEGEGEVVDGRGACGTCRKAPGKVIDGSGRRSRRQQGHCAPPPHRGDPPTAPPDSAFPPSSPCPLSSSRPPSTPLSTREMSTAAGAPSGCSASTADEDGTTCARHRSGPASGTACSSTERVIPP